MEASKRHLVVGEYVRTTAAAAGDTRIAGTSVPGTMAAR
jgi:hypothetical protein